MHYSDAIMNNIWCSRSSMLYCIGHDASRFVIHICIFSLCSTGTTHKDMYAAPVEDRSPLIKVVEKWRIGPSLQQDRRGAWLQDPRLKCLYATTTSKRTQNWAMFNKTKSQSWKRNLLQIQKRVLSISCIEFLFLKGPTEAYMWRITCVDEETTVI